MELSAGGDNGVVMTDCQTKLVFGARFLPGEAWLVAAGVGQLLSGVEIKYIGRVTEFARRAQQEGAPLMPPPGRNPPTAPRPDWE